MIQPFNHCTIWIVQRSMSSLSAASRPRLCLKDQPQRLNGTSTRLEPSGRLSANPEKIFFPNKRTYAGAGGRRWA
jgi:hypothetical protein